MSTVDEAKSLVVSFAQSGSMKKFLLVALCVVMAFGAGFGSGYLYRKPVTYVATTLHEVLPTTEQVKESKKTLKKKEVETHAQAVEQARQVAPDLVSAGAELDRLMAEWRDCTSSDQ